MEIYFCHEKNHLIVSFVSKISPNNNMFYFPLPIILHQHASSSCIFKNNAAFNQIKTPKFGTSGFIIPEALAGDEWW